MSLQVYDMDWVAGLWEAEGTVYSHKLGTSKVRMAIQMTDFDTIKHVQTLLGGVGCTYIKKINMDAPSSVIFKKQPKDQLGLEIYRYKQQLYVLGVLLPRLFERRFNNILEKVKGVESYTYTQPSITLPWLAGYLEGEATFIYKGNTQTVGVRCTDVDVLQALADYMGKGDIRQVKRAVGREDVNKYKTMYMWELYGQNARNLMQQIYPMMSNRRQWQIRRCFNKGVDTDTLSVV